MASPFCRVISILYLYAMEILRLFLLPFAFLYGMGVRLRNLFFDWGLLRQQKFPFPVISVGNLTTGGTGKTPHIEYLIRLLSPDYKIATLSRGYGRKTRGFFKGKPDDNALRMGDEPMQYIRKFSGISVFVDEKRRRGIRQILKDESDVEVVLLDDAFQHRYVRPGLSIILTDYLKPYPDNYLLPAGSLREPVSGAKRADIIVVTKSPKVLSPITRRSMMAALKPVGNQNVYFSFIRYGEIIPLWDSLPKPEPDHKYSTILLFAGIANVYPIQEYLSDLCFELITIPFSDHYHYKSSDLDRINKNFSDLYSRNKLLITTEKDVMRLLVPGLDKQVRGMPIHYLPIEVRFHKQDRQAFDEQIKKYVSENQRKS